MATVQTSSPKALAFVRQSFRARPKIVLAFFALAAIAVALAVQTITPLSKNPFSGGLPFSGSSGDSKSERRGFDPVAQVKSIFAAFAGRSPGERTQAELLLVKKQRREAISRRKAVQRPPQQRALGKVFKPGTVEAPATRDAQVAVLSGVPNFPFGPLENPSLSDAVGNLPPNLGAPFGPGGGFPVIGFPGGGLPGGNTPGTPPQPPAIGVPPGPSVPPIGEVPGEGEPVIPPIQPPVPPVPEPDTWMMLLLGFGAIGYSLRRRREGAARPAAA